MSDEVGFCLLIYFHCIGLYIDDIISTLRQPGYGIYVGNILYAGDIILLSCSYCGLHKMVTLCSKYGVHWDIKFNPTKSHCISFGAGRHPPFTVMLNDTVVKWVDKVKYPGCCFKQTYTMYSSTTQKYYGNLVVF